MQKVWSNAANCSEISAISFIKNRLSILMRHLHNTQTLNTGNQKCMIVLCVHYQISQDYPGYRNFFQDSKAGSNTNFQ